MGREHERERKEEIDDDERNTKKNRFKSNGISPKNKTGPTLTMPPTRLAILRVLFHDKNTRASISRCFYKCASISWCFYKCASISWCFYKCASISFRRRNPSKWNPKKIILLIAILLLSFASWRTKYMCACPTFGKDNEHNP